MGDTREARDKKGRDVEERQREYELEEALEHEREARERREAREEDRADDELSPDE